ncbi:hypothetical protein JST97_32555 [bacterium]|nr:hypothetical protein [bacterium]
MMQPFQPLGPRQPPWVADSASLLKRNQLGVDAEAKAAPQDSVSFSKKDKEREEREKNQKTYRRPTYPMPPAPVPKQPAGGFILKNAPQQKPAEKPMKEEDLPGYGRWSAPAPEPEPWPDLELEADWGIPDWLEPLLADPPERPGRLRLAWLLARFGKGMVERCIDFGLTLQLGAEFARHDLRVTILSGAPVGQVYEAFAGAYDLALGDGSPASLSSLAVLSNYHQCRAQENRWSGPDHFFAEQLSAFLQAQSAASVAMAGYVDYLLKQSHG